MNLTTLFQKPGIIGIVADVNQGKSMTVYHVLNALRAQGTFKLVTYGLRVPIENAVQIHSIAELELVRNSLVVCDEYFTLFDLEDRKKRRTIEQSLRLINHNNNVLVLVGTPDNFKKFISAKLDAVILKKLTLADCINGSRLKDIVMSYKGPEQGSAVLNLDIGVALIYDGQHYHKIEVPYLKQFDTKKANEAIVQWKKR